jgi:hypothetical protein
MVPSLGAPPALSTRLLTLGRTAALFVSLLLLLAAMMLELVAHELLLSPFIVREKQAALLGTP